MEITLFRKRLDEIAKQDLGMLVRAERSIELCEKTLYNFKNEILKSGFSNHETEILFFKNIKTIPLTNLIYFSEIHSFELQFPKADRRAKEKYIRNKVRRINQFFVRNIDFIRYVESGNTHFDRQYFTREFLKYDRITSSRFYFQDPDFSTSRDMLLSKFWAYVPLINFMENRIIEQPQSFIDSTGKIAWPFSHADWVELVYALYAVGLNNNADLNIIELSKQLQKIFDYTPTQKIYKVYQSLKNRKNRSMFMDQLKTALIYEMDKSEE